MDRAIRGQTGSLSPLRTMTRAEIAGTTNYEILTLKKCGKQMQGDKTKVLLISRIELSDCGQKRRCNGDACRSQRI